MNECKEEAEGSITSFLVGLLVVVPCILCAWFFIICALIFGKDVPKSLASGDWTYPMYTVACALLGVGFTAIVCYITSRGYNRKGNNV